MDCDLEDLFCRSYFQAAEECHNICLETTGTLGKVGRRHWQEAIERVGSERVIYGNDYPWASSVQVSRDMEFIESLSLTREEKGTILGGNLERLTGIDREHA